MHYYPVTVSWQEYENNIKKLIHKIKESQITIDSVICLSEDAFMIAQAIKKYFALTDRIEIYQNAETLPHALNSVLLVHDIVEYKTPMQEVIEQLKKRGAVSIKSATIWQRTDTGFSPDFYISMLAQFEKLETPFNNFNNRVILKS